MVLSYRCRPNPVGAEQADEARSPQGQGVESSRQLGGSPAGERHTVVPIQSATISFSPSITRAISSCAARASYLSLT
jgi:hypothetical protein